jgi:hypothetical protein
MFGCPILRAFAKGGIEYAQSAKPPCGCPSFACHPAGNLQLPSPLVPNRKRRHPERSEGSPHFALPAMTRVLKNKVGNRGKFSTSSIVVSKNQRGYTLHHVFTTKKPSSAHYISRDPPQKHQQNNKNARPHQRKKNHYFLSKGRTRGRTFFATTSFPSAVACVRSRCIIPSTPNTPCSRNGSKGTLYFFASSV